MPFALALPDLAVLLSVLLLLALAYAYDNTIGALLRAVASWFLAQTIHGPFGLSIGLGFIGRAIQGLDNHIRDWLDTAIRETEYAFHKMFHWTAYLVQEATGAVANLAEATEQRLYQLEQHTLGAAITTATAGTRRAVAALEAKVAGITGTIEHDLSAVEQDAQHAARTAEAAAAGAVHTAEVAVPRAARAAIATTLPRIRGLEHDATELFDRVKRIGRTLTPAGILGLAAAAIARYGLGWAKCSNVDRAAKQLCGMDHDLLDSLLADATLILGTVSLVEFAKGMQDVTGDFAGAVRFFWRA